MVDHDSLHELFGRVAALEETDPLRFQLARHVITTTAPAQIERLQNEVLAAGTYVKPDSEQYLKALARVGAEYNILVAELQRILGVAMGTRNADPLDLIADS